MEGFNATENFTQNQSPLKEKLRKVTSVFKSLDTKQWLGVISVLILVISILITLGLTQQVQKFFSKASSNPGSYGYGDYGLSNYAGLFIGKKVADLDGDGDVDLRDYNAFVRDYRNKNLRSDFDDNGVVDLADLNTLIKNFGK